MSNIIAKEIEEQNLKDMIKNLSLSIIQKDESILNIEKEKAEFEKMHSSEVINLQALVFCC